jgi:para-aminobenzoate synthetase component 1
MRPSDILGKIRCFSNLSAKISPQSAAVVIEFPTMPNAPRQETDSLTTITIPYSSDSSNLFERIRHLPHAVWLDSGPGQMFNDSRYDICCAQPTKVLTTKAARTRICSSQGEFFSTDNPFDLVEQALAELPSVIDMKLPFTGGAMGYFGYHLNRHLERLPTRPVDDVALPDMLVGIYDWALIQDHHKQQAFALFLPTVSDDQQRQILELVENFQPSGGAINSFKIKNLRSECNEESYFRSLTKILGYIEAGDVYQVNFAQRFSAVFEGDPFRAYCHLRRLLPAPYSAFIKTGDDGAILSHSPELFLSVVGNQVLTKPIKGTRPRGQDRLADNAMKSELLTSAKDQAENLMIVDLLRNDLGKHCVPGTIHVPELFALQTFENVHHLVSTVVGTLKAESTTTQLLRDCFPGGSITGAPKIRAMEIIAELEQTERSAYCGSIGYLSCNGSMETNIAIRTVAANRNRLYAWGGGGIVADSDPASEYQECLDKIGILLQGLSDPDL